MLGVLLLLTHWEDELISGRRAARKALLISGFVPTSFLDQKKIQKSENPRNSK